MRVETHDPKAVFLKALDQPTPEAQAAFLDRVCGDNDPLRVRVEELLRAHNRAGGFLRGSPSGSDTVDIRPDTVKSGTQIGRYTVLQQIGAGGMGMVYLAEQSEPVRRQVALKIIRPGMDSREVVARFEAERQALAIMDHPNIARVLDAGQTEQGSPYFVMELVRGVPVTEFCDQQHLTPRQRLELFIPICRAVQHAHQKGIIHRDIKPGNILVSEVDGRAVPKVIDFGVAKATGRTLSNESIATQLGQIVGTLEYMSPEQANPAQLDVDTRSDIYSLGVLLYELLTGSPPFDRRRLGETALDEILRIIREEDPPRPSTRLNDSDTLPAIAASRHVRPDQLKVVVRGELDWIVMKALEKDRASRYQTAGDFATDVQCHLEEKPILARPISARERAVRWLRRNPVIAAASAISLLAITIGVCIAFLSLKASRDRALELAAAESRVAERERRANAETRAALKREAGERRKAEDAHAEQEQATEEAIAVRDFLILDMISAADPGRVPGHRLTVRQMLDHATSRVATRFPDQRRTQAVIRVAIGKAYYSLGLFDDSFAQFHEAWKIQKELLGADHEETLKTAIEVGASLHGQGRFAEQQEFQEEILTALSRKHGDDSQQVIELKGNIAANVHSRGLYEEARQLLEDVLKQKVEILGPEHESTLSTMSNLALNYERLGRLVDGETMLREVIDIRTRNQGEDHPKVLSAKGNLAVILETQNRSSDAEKLIREVLQTSRRVLGEEHPSTLAAWNNLAFNLQKQNRYEETNELYERLLKIYRRLFGSRHPSTLTIANNAAMRLMDQRDYAAAERELRAVSKIAAEVLGPSHRSTIEITRNHAQVLVHLQQTDEAEVLMSRVLTAQETEFGLKHVKTLDTLVACAGLRLRLGRYDQVKRMCERAVPVCLQEFGRDDPHSLQARNILALAKLNLGEFAEASQEIAELLEDFSRHFGQESIPVLQLMHSYGSALAKLGQVDRAIIVFEKITSLQRRLLPSEAAAHKAVAEIINQLRQGNTDLMTIRIGHPVPPSPDSSINP